MIRPDLDRKVRRLFDARAKRDFERLEGLVACDVVARWHDGREFRGRETVLAAAAGAEDMGTSYTVHSVAGRDGCALVTGRHRVSDGRGHSDRPIAWIMRFAETGELVESTAFASREEAERMFPVVCG